MHLDRLLGIAAAATALTLVACSSGTTTGSARGTGASTDFGTLNGAHIELSSVGGFAALSISDAASYDNHAFVHVERHICDKDCGAPLDSTAGTLSQPAIDSLFTVALGQARQLDKSDYGETKNGADMMSYTLRLTSGGSVRTITADDGTMPPPMRRIVEAVRGSIAGAQR
jgi:hypothetical protein